MIVSHKHRFIFVKNRKTAGTSIEIGLGGICGDHDIITPISPKDERARVELGYRGAQRFNLPLKSWSSSRILKAIRKRNRKSLQFYSHIPSTEIVNHLPKDVWNNYFKFTVERNPYDKVVSFFFWRNGHKKYKSVADFIEDGGLWGKDGFDLYSINGSIAVDKVYFYEDLDFLEKDLTKRLKLEQRFELPKYRAKSHHRQEADYHKVLDARAIELISEKYAREIDLFGYEF